MADLGKALATLLADLRTRTGKTLDEPTQLTRPSGLSTHSELVAMLEQTLGRWGGDANTIVHLARQADRPAAGASAETSSARAATGAAALRSIRRSQLRPAPDS